MGDMHAAVEQQMVKGMWANMVKMMCLKVEKAT
jgi:hypothetical protein